jgi:hypothetical protein
MRGEKCLLEQKQERGRWQKTSVLAHTAQRFSSMALMQSVLLRGAAQRIKHLSRFLAERSLIFQTTLHRIIVTPEWCFQRE